MSYQVLARKWRPSNFGEVVGQEHVLKALVSALDSGRLHHAYLFSGTRGVGKTTLARIFAKSLNCHTGVSSTPCGECEACTQISEGRFVDLIEVDAASRTGIDDTRELLENVQYAPTVGRYKVYLIDEVHMLSNSSFNALLKTLEEPPEHVKFLFATTDPQKLPVTVLSRCLQFNLKNLGSERIVEYLTHILQQEEIDVEQGALWLISRAADGSMRDALSLTDQAIAHGSGSLQESEVSAMLGTIDRKHVYGLLEAIIVRDPSSLLAQLEELSDFAPDYGSVLEEMLGVLHRIAIAQAAPDALDNSLGDRESVLDMAGRILPEETQILFQMALLGRKELTDSPSLRVGFEMALLRMLAFQPDPDGRSLASATEASSQKPAESVIPEEPDKAKKPETVPAAREEAPLEQKPVTSVDATLAAEDPVIDPNALMSIAQEQVPAAQIVPTAQIENPAEQEQAPTETFAATAEPDLSVGVTAPISDSTNETLEEEATAEETHSEPALELVQSEAVEETVSPTAPPPGELGPETWVDWFYQLGLKGPLRAIASHLVLADFDGRSARFLLDNSNAGLLRDQHQEALSQILSERTGLALDVQIQCLEIDSSMGESAHQREQRLDAERRAKAQQQILGDPFIQSVIETFDAKADEKSLRFYDS